MPTITHAAELVQILTGDPTERLICTHGADEPTAWHLVMRRHEVAAEVVRELLDLAGADPDRPCLVPVDDGLFPGASQTFRFSVTLQELVEAPPKPPRKRGRPPKPNAPDVAERMAKSRERRARREVHTLLLVAALAEQASPQALERLEAHRTFGLILRDAKLTARALSLASLESVD